MNIINNCRNGTPKVYLKSPFKKKKRFSGSQVDVYKVNMERRIYLTIHKGMGLWCATWVGAFYWTKAVDKILTLDHLKCRSLNSWACMLCAKRRMKLSTIKKKDETINCLIVQCKFASVVSWVKCAPTVQYWVVVPK